MLCHYHFNDGGTDKERKRQRTNESTETKRFLREGWRAHKTSQRRKLPIGTVTHVDCVVGVDLCALYFCLSLFFTLFFLSATEKTLHLSVTDSTLMANDSVAFVILWLVLSLLLSSSLTLSFFFLEVMWPSLCILARKSLWQGSIGPITTLHL